MDTCTNCGATLRPGAKFCTTCGTRLNDQPVSNQSWGAPQESDAQETSVLNAVQPPASTQKETPADEDSSQSFGGWGNAWGTSTTTSTGAGTSDDPASRFISALDDEVKPVEEEETSSGNSAATWNSSTTVFTPPPPSNWSYVAGADTPAESKDTEADDSESGWRTPSTWSTVESSEESTDETVESEEPDAAGFTEHGADEVDYLSGDENIEISGPDSVTLPPDEARDKAIALADELRRMIRMMSSGGDSDQGAAAMGLTEASLNVSDFSDLRGVLVDVKNDPHNIQNLSTLAAKVDRIEALLDEHASLSESIEKAIADLTGQALFGNRTGT